MPDVHLPENTLVRVELVESTAPEQPSTGPEDPLTEAAKKVAKPRPHWPGDYALNHGHYVSGEPKKQ